jgi:hypothetical protein
MERSVGFHPIRNESKRHSDMNETIPRFRRRLDIVKALSVDPSATEKENDARFAEFFEASCRWFGSDICGKCEQVTLLTDGVRFDAIDSKTSVFLCSCCREEFEDHVRALPLFVTDSDLPTFLPIFAAMFVRGGRGRCKL